MAHLGGGGQQVMDISFWRSEEKGPWETVIRESEQVQIMQWSERYHTGRLQKKKQKQSRIKYTENHLVDRS